MSSPSASPAALSGALEHPRLSSAWAGDSLLASVVVLLVMTVVQRGIGLARSMLLCRWLSPAELGQWDLTLGFLELAAPVAVLGIPGTFGRYVQRYRHSGQLAAFLRQTAGVSAILVAATVLGLLIFAEKAAQLVYGTTEQAGTVRLVAWGLAAVVSHFFLTTLLSSLLQNRRSARQEVIHSLTFTALALLLVGGWGDRAEYVLAAYLLASALASLVGWVWLRGVTADARVSPASLSARQLWPALLPFALWVWGTNWLSNLFDLADRAMIVHFSGLSSTAALEWVGNYHSARIVPLVLVALTTSLGTMLTPYLSRDWETGQRELVGVRLNLFIKSVGWLLSASAVALLWLSPVVFGTLLKGKYALGPQLLPWTLTYCVWFGVARVAQKYLWCAEQVRLAAWAWAAGLAVNVLLNLLLLPRYGLPGVVLATAAGNLVSLLLIGLGNLRCGLRLDGGVLLVAALPLVLHAGAAVATLVVLGLLVWSWRSRHLLDERERRLLAETWQGIVARVAKKAASGQGA